MRKYPTDYRQRARFFAGLVLPPWLLLAEINSAEYLWRLTGHDGHSNETRPLADARPKPPNW
jgi:hypothetical protein